MLPGAEGVHRYDPAMGVEPQPPTTGTAPTGGSEPAGRDAFIDFVRAVSLLIVVAWHWVFTIVIWRHDGPHASNPIGFTRGLFIATWLFQVMPLFFFVGGYAHTEAWEAGHARGRFRSTTAFAWYRMKHLARPALALAFGWWVLGTVIMALTDLDGIPRVVRLVLSPLWFIAVYLILIALFPITHRLHERFGALVLVWGVGLAVLFDAARFAHHVTWAGWANFFVVWATCHQLGYFWEPLVAAGRRVAWGLMWGGLFALAGLVGSRLYPGSMVGVPGDRFSNMAPPTICILALLSFQAGVALLVRPWVLERLASSRRWRTTNEVINRFSLPLFLFHSTGMALFATFAYEVFGLKQLREPTAVWWLQRPIMLGGALLFTMPVILVLGRSYVKPPARSHDPAGTLDGS